MTCPTARRWARRWSLGLALSLVAATTVLAQAPALSPDARVSLVTVSPGTALYSAYGHTALRVVDPQLGLDYVFNYGTFDFQTEGFYWKFARGRLDYMLSVHGFDVLVAHAADERRGVTEQVLALSPEQATRLFALLMDNYRVENRFYRYDFFYDNCATRVRDMISRACGKSLVWGERPVASQSFRQLIHPYHTPLVDLGIDLALGRPADRQASQADRAFLPDELQANVAAARLGDRALVRQTQVVLPSLPPAPRALDTPLLVAALLALALLGHVALSWRSRRAAPRPYRLPAVVRLVLGLVALLGVLVAFLAFFTDHAATAQNLNLLWAWPTHLLYLALPTTARWARLRVGYAALTGGTSLLVPAVSLLGLQAIHPAAQVLAVALGVVLLYAARAEASRAESPASAA